MSNKELFVKAFLEAEKIEYAPFLDDSVEWEVSKAFERKMNALINKNNHIKLSSRRRISRSLIAALIAVLIAFAGTMSVSATRAPFVEFVEKVFSKYIEVTVSKDSTLPVETIETEYTLSDVPKGYKVSRYDKSDAGVFTVWKNENGDEIVLSQDILNMSLSIDNEHYLKEVNVNGHKGYLNIYSKNATIWWSDGEYSYMINAPNEYKNELVKMAENVKEKN